MRRLLVLLTPLALACGSSGPDEDSDWPAGYYMIVNPSALILGTDSSFHFGSAVYDNQTNAIPGVPISYSSNNRAVAIVDDTGTVTAVSHGTATITVRSRNLVMSRLVIVTTSGTILGRHTQNWGFQSQPWAVAIHGDDLYIGSIGGAGGLFHGSVSNRTIDPTILRHGDVPDIALSAAGDSAWFLSGGGLLGMTVPDATPFDTMPGVFGLSFISLARLRNSTGFLAGSTDGRVVSVSPSLDAVATATLGFAPIHRLLPSSLEDALYVAEAGNVWRFSIDHDTVGAGSKLLADRPQAILDLLLTPGESHLVASTQIEDFATIGLPGGQVSYTPLFGNSESVDPGPLPNTIIVTSYVWQGRVFLFDTQSGQFTRVWRVGGTPRHAAVGPNGVIVVTNSDGWVDFLQ